MKQKLKIEALAVESFVVAEEEHGPRSTVRAFAKPPRGETVADFTCLVDDCQPTFGQSCVQTQCTVVPRTINELTCLVDDCQPTFVYSCPYGPETCAQ